MNNLIKFFVMASCIFMFACDDAQPIITETNSSRGKLYEVSLNLGGFDEISGTTTRSTSPFIERARFLYYIVYEDNEEMIYARKTIEGNPINTNLNLRLANGNYTIALVMAEKKLDIYIGGEPMVRDSFHDTSSFTYDDLTVDVFSTVFRIKVDGKNETQNVTLTRPIGQIKFAVNDLHLAPEEVKTITPVLVGWGYKDYDNPDFRGISIPYGIMLNQKSIVFTNRKNDTFYQLPTYNSVRIPRANFSLINESNPFTFYLPQLVSLDRMRSVFIPAGFDLYLQGSKDENVQLDLASPNIAFMKLIKKGFTLDSKQSITIKGSVFNSQGLSLQINDTWSEIKTEEF